MARDGERPGVVAARPIDGDLALVVDAGGLEAAFDRGRRDKDGRDPEDRRLRGAVAAIGRHDIHLRSGREAPCVVLLDARNVGGDLRADRRGVESRDRRFGVDIGRARRSHQEGQPAHGDGCRRLDRQLEGLRSTARGRGDRTDAGRRTRGEDAARADAAEHRRHDAPGRHDLWHRLVELVFHRRDELSGLVGPEPQRGRCERDHGRRGHGADGRGEALVDHRAVAALEVELGDDRRDRPALRVDDDPVLRVVRKARHIPRIDAERTATAERPD